MEELKTPDRDQAARLLVRWVREQAIPQESPDWQACSGLAREIVWTCLRHKGILDGWVDHLSQQPPGKRIRPFLWIGLSQLFLMDGIPEHAAVHETMETARRLKVATGQLRYLNAIFRNALRRKEGLLEWWEFNIPEKRYSHPEFLIERWNQSFGEEKTLAILEWNQKRAHTYARKTGRASSSMEFDEEISEFPGDERFYLLPRKLNPVDLPEFQQGAWYIQDPATALAPDLLKAQPGEQVLDACAAPGGKTSLLLDAMGRDTNTLWAMDPQPRRVKRLQENLNRLGAPNVHVETCTPAEVPESLRNSFDAILLDVPCSNTGVFQRRPDTKWSLTSDSFSKRAEIQLRILTDCIRLVAPGGRMVYSTCCIEAEETTGLIERFLQQNPSWRKQQEILRLPGEQQTDGAYACLLMQG